MFLRGSAISPLQLGFVTLLQERLTFIPRRDATTNRRLPLVTVTPRRGSKAKLKPAPGHETTMLSGAEACFAGAAPAAAAPAMTMATIVLGTRVIVRWPGQRTARARLSTPSRDA